MANLRAKDFEPGKPKILAFKAAGQNVDGSFGPQVRFTTTAGDFVYLDETPANDVEEAVKNLGIAWGEDFRLGKSRTSHGGSRFVVERLPARDAGGHHVPDADPFAGFPRSPQTFAAPPQAVAMPASATAMKPAAACMMASMMTAVDAIIEVQAYATRKGMGLTFSEESVMKAALSIYIDACKNGGR